MDIRILPSNIANMIAAGEVIQRPASVVKELMENALDAGASSVSVIISDAGKTLIQVIDDGCGMSPDEAVLCFERHATSKITTADDIMDIHTFGFRGEALASIAAVSEVTLKTRRAEDETGCEVIFADSHHVSTKEVTVAAGANFAVRNLFYNVPARRKFLKSDNVEMKHIVSEFIKIALTRYDINFSISHNNKDILVLKKTPSLKFRIQDILGNQVVDEIVDLKVDTSVVGIFGYIGRPDAAKKTQTDQFFFVNGRYFRSPYFHKAVMKAYEQLIPEGLLPSYFIYLSVDPKAMDVNIHPTKTEIKFEEDSVIFQILYAAVKEVLGKNSFGGSIDFDKADAPEIPVFSSNYQETHAIVEPRIKSDPTYNPFDNECLSFVDHRDDYGKLFEEKTLPSSQILVIKEKYILTPIKSGLLLINIRRAKEKILYRQYLSAVKRSVTNGRPGQKALFPVKLNIGADKIFILREHNSLLSSIGFGIEELSASDISVTSLPEGYSAEPVQVEKTISDLISVLSDNSFTLIEDMDSDMATRLAILGAMSATPVRNNIEAQRLVDDLFSCENPELSPTGKKTMVIISLDELETKLC